jgi:hypothetical protein
VSENGKQAPTPEELEKQIEGMRQDLAETVDALSAKLDVKTRARERVDQVRGRVTGQVGHLRDVATDDQGRPTPQTIAVAAAGAAVLLGVTVLLVGRRNR